MARTVNISLTGLHGIMGKARALENTMFARPMMSEIGMYILAAIKKRTLVGDDVNGIAFKPYNPMYAKVRKDAGFTTKPVDLTRSGSMLSSMIYTSDTNSTDVFFMNTSDPSDTKNPNKAFWLNEDREFFALSLKDFKGIMSVVHKYYNKLLRS